MGKHYLQKSHPLQCLYGPSLYFTMVKFQTLALKIHILPTELIPQLIQ